VPDVTEPDYWLIDLSTGAGQGCYGSLNEGLQAVVDEDRPSVEQRLAVLAIVVFNRDGSLEHVGNGEALLEQAHRQFPAIGCRYGLPMGVQTSDGPRFNFRVPPHSAN
jgi:hypothetical protein